MFQGKKKNNNMVKSADGRESKILEKSREN